MNREGLILSPPHLIHRLIMYDPGIRTGHLLSVTSGPQGKWNVYYTLDNILADDGEDNPIDWLNWKPERVCITVVMGVVGSQTYCTYSTDCYECDDLNGVDMSCDSSGWTIRPYGEMLEQILVRGIKHGKSMIKRCPE